MIKGMISRLLEYIFQNILPNFHEIKVCGGVWFIKIPRIHSFGGALKTQKFFKPNQISK